MREPTQAVFLQAEWRHLVMLNYEADPAILLPRVPVGTELDSWDGRTLVSMVGFMFLRTRVMGMPIPFHTDFEEVNLRFYVRRKGPEGWRRGVVFVREIVPRRAVAWVARTLYNEPYVRLPMRHRLEFAAGNTSFAYEWRQAGAWATLSCESAAPLENIAEGSEEEFVTEHYWGYVRQRDGSTAEYQVEHPRWRVASATRATLECEARPLYGDALSEVLRGRPSSAFLADGSPVTVRRGRRLHA